MPLEADFFAWTMQNGFGCRNGYPVGDRAEEMYGVKQGAKCCLQAPNPSSFAGVRLWPRSAVLISRLKKTLLADLL
jgi:hypothetical protein